MRSLIAILAAGLTCSLGLPAAIPQTSTTRPKKPAPAANQKTTAARTARSSHPSRTGHKTSARAPHYVVQAAPTPERYKQFQQALIAKGYLHGEATGTWDDASADAMRRFQKDQNLEPTGKPNTSLSIIALGLGPKY